MDTLPEYKAHDHDPAVCAHTAGSWSGKRNCRGKEDCIRTLHLYSGWFAAHPPMNNSCHVVIYFFQLWCTCDLSFFIFGALVISHFSSLVLSWALIFSCGAPVSSHFFIFCAPMRAQFYCFFRVCILEVLVLGLVHLWAFIYSCDALVSFHVRLWCTFEFLFCYGVTWELSYGALVSSLFSSSKFILRSCHSLYYILQFLSLLKVLFIIFLLWHFF